jgi:urease gamma subunit
MISIRAEVKGETDAPPFMRFFECRDDVDELLLFELIKRIEDKLSNNLKINTNESLVMYCGYIIKHLRNHVSIPDIEKRASKLLHPLEVMIGVPETLRRISFFIKLDNLPRKKILFHEPISIMPYKEELYLNSGYSNYLLDSNKQTMTY